METGLLACQRSVVTCCFTLCSWKHGCLARAGSPKRQEYWPETGRAHAAQQTSSATCQLCGSRGEEVQSGTTPSPRPTSSLSSGPRSPWIEGREVLILTPTLTMPAPWPVDGERRLRPARSAQGPRGRQNPSWGNGNWDQACSVVPSPSYKRQIQR